MLNGKVKKVHEEPKVSYQLSEADPKENEDRLNRAFGILFDEMLRQGKIKFKKYPQG